MKGRARLYVGDDLVAFAPVKIEKPKSGVIVWDMMEVKELFEMFHAFLRLPQDYEITGVFFDIVYHRWVLIVESDAIPLPEPGVMLPRINPSYQRTEDGKVRLVDLNITER